MKAVTVEEIKQVLKSFPMKLSQRNLWILRAYGDGRNCCKFNLHYDSQLEFKRVAQRYFGLDRNLYYFDNIFCVDARTDKTIPGVACDGSLQWGEAIDKLKAYFNINN